ncbi:predicted protein [Nematostella vectensis]|uniref:G-protein coupled receptors family 1 profile domain-containing protein n=1 Tax=Nematostella vectensis TaxID=45351 RepID=A7RMD8_NEMVE|nr:predicted protein [Nematostella vectensis]|eukprot:XP_001639317.1 predicted protein [Nematostella vectensis]
MENGNISKLSAKAGSPRLDNTIEGCFMITLAILAVIGNSLIIFAIYKNRNLRTLRNLFIASLAFSDLSMACTDMLYQAIWKLVPNYKPPHFSVCYFILLTGVLFGAASVFNLTAMTLNRYIAVMYPLHYSIYVTPKRSSLILMLIWLAAFCLAIPPLIWRPVEVVCYSTEPSEEHFINEVVYMASEWVFWFVIPAIIICISYGRIYGVAKHQLRQIASLDRTRRGFCPPGADELSSKMKMTAMREKKAGRMVAILIGFYLFCWLPFFTVLTIHKFQAKAVPPILMRIFLGLMFTNSAVNPLILTLHNREMKNALRKLFCGNRGANFEYELTAANGHSLRSRAATISTNSADLRNSYI